MIAIFTDGSSRGNPGPGGWGAIIRTDDIVVELGGREAHTTNNRMELSAAIGALHFVFGQKLSETTGIVIQTDSKYVIQGITGWVASWQRNGWKTAAKKDVENRDLWEALAAAALGSAIQWKYVKGHAGHPGNERCDEIATAFADNETPDLYNGPRAKYTVDLDAIPTASMVAAASSSKKRSGPAYSYLSLVDGVLEKHKTWPECESRVKRVKGARFKKSMNAEDERKIIEEWKNI